MTASAVFILDVKGKVIISRNYRGDVPMNCVERFSGHVLEADEGDERPVWLEHGTTYVYVKYNNLYIMAVTQRNSNAAMILLFLYRLVEVFKDYFKELEEESIRDNFVITYELMDEMMDFGYPQISESKILREYITQEAHKLQVEKLPMAVTNAVSWRSEGIKHRKNEIFLDVVERLNLLVAANGTLLRSEILGSLKMRSYLSGMPELKLGLNDKLLFEATGRRAGGRGLSKGKAVEMEDIKFHQCVRLARFENDRTISFIPPDGEFELMSYRLSTQARAPACLQPAPPQPAPPQPAPPKPARASPEPPPPDLASRDLSRAGVCIRPGEASDLDRGRRRAALAQPHRVHDQGQVAVQAAQHGQQRRDPHPGAVGRRLALVQDLHRDSQVRSGARRHRLEHQAVPRRQGIPDASALWFAEREQRGGQEGQAADHRQVRDPLLHRLGDPGPLPQDYREERLPGASLGPLHHAKRRLPAPHVVRTALVAAPQQLPALAVRARPLWSSN